MSESMLVIEDDETFSATLVRALKRRGYEVAAAGSAAAAETAGAGLAAAGSAETATGAGAAIGIPTMVLAATATATSKVARLTEAAGKHATGAMDSTIGADRP